MVVGNTGVTEIKLTGERQVFKVCHCLRRPSCTFTIDSTVDVCNKRQIAVKVFTKPKGTSDILNIHSYY